MKAPVLVVADAASARAIRMALAEFDVTVTESVTRASALASTGAFLCVFTARGFGASVQGALESPVPPRTSLMQLALRSRARRSFRRRRRAPMTPER